MPDGGAPSQAMSQPDFSPYLPLSGGGMSAMPRPESRYRPPFPLPESCRGTGGRSIPRDGSGVSTAPDQQGALSGAGGYAGIIRRQCTSLRSSRVAAVPTPGIPAWPGATPRFRSAEMSAARPGASSAGRLSRGQGWSVLRRRDNPPAWATTAPMADLSAGGISRDMSIGNRPPPGECVLSGQGGLLTVPHLIGAAIGENAPICLCLLLDFCCCPAIPSL